MTGVQTCALPILCGFANISTDRSKCDVLDHGGRVRRMRVLKWTDGHYTVPEKTRWRVCRAPEAYAFRRSLKNHERPVCGNRIQNADQWQVPWTDMSVLIEQSYAILAPRRQINYMFFRSAISIVVTPPAQNREMA